MCRELIGIDRAVYSTFGPVGYKRFMRNHHAPEHVVTLDSVKTDFINLIEQVRYQNPSACIVPLAVIPRLDDWSWSKSFYIELNDFIQRWCCDQQSQGSKAIFVTSYSLLLKKGEPVSDYYKWDGIHLSEKGLLRVKQCIQQAISSKNICKGGEWKRKPQGWGNPSGKRRRVVKGNLIVF